jgi:hypothetical protein
MTSINAYIRPAAATRHVPHDGRPVSPAAILRWIRAGVKTKDGRRIKLQAIRTPGGWLTRADWIDAFLDSLTCDGAETTRPPQATERARAAMSRLAERGF